MRRPVAKTYKLYVGGAFARSESGRHLAVTDHAGNHVANVPRATRKDVRDAVRAARGALPGWQGRTAYNRGQILYRFAEALESRAGELVRETERLRGVDARAEIDAAVDQAVEGIVNGIFFNQGHVCCAGSRLFLQESVAEEVVEKLWRRMSLLRVGDPLDKNTDVGAINSAAQLQRIEALVAAGEQEGATRRTVACKLPERGYWFPPTMFTDVAPVNRIAVEEIFGPVVSVLTFRTQAEAIEKANASAYGLAAGIWTDKGSRALAVARGLKAGTIWQNTYNQFDPSSPFGGYKESGFGREGGLHGLEPYLRFD